VTRRTVKKKTFSIPSRNKCQPTGDTRIVTVGVKKRSLTLGRRMCSYKRVRKPLARSQTPSSPPPAPVNPISSQWQRPGCAARDVSLTSSISSITCIRRTPGVTGSALDGMQRLNYPWGGGEGGEGGDTPVGGCRRRRKQKTLRLRRRAGIHHNVDRISNPAELFEPQPEVLRF